MDSGDPNFQQILDVVQEIRTELSLVRDRIDRLEADAAPAATAPSGEASAAPGDEPAIHAPGVDPEVVMTIAAAVAAYLGKKAPIRSIHLVGTEAWAREGRSTMQGWYSVSPPPSPRG